MPPSFYKSFLTSPLQLAGTETEVFVNALTTMTGETIAFSNFTPFTRGIIIIDPEAQFGTQPEIISFTGIDTVNFKFTGCVRGLSSINATTVAANKVYHGTNTPVIISWGAQNISDFSTYVASLVSGALGTASNSMAGSTKVTLNMGTKPRAKSAHVSEQTPPDLTLKVNAFATIGPAGLVIYAGGNTSAYVAPVSNPRVDLVVYNTLSSTLTTRAGSEGVTPATPAPSDGDIVLCEIFHRVGETSLKEVDDSTNGYIRRWYELTPFGVYPPTGSIFGFGVASAPTGYLLCDGTAVSRTTYAQLFSVIGTGYGVGDGSTTFNVPDYRGRIIVGAGTGSKVFTFASRSSNTITVTGSTNANNNSVVTGQAVTYHTTSGAITGLTNDTVYYIIASAYNQFSLASSLANAQNGTAISLSSDGSGTQTFTLALSLRTIGDVGGEENHAMSSTELLSHFHTVNSGTSAFGSPTLHGSGDNLTTNNTNSTGGNVAMNNMQPFGVAAHIIKT